MSTEPEILVDVAALTALLDGRYKQVRDLVRENLVLHRHVLDEAETLDTTAYRERVKDVVVELAKTGQTGYGFPKEHGGGGDIGASVAAFETSAMGDLSVLVKLGVQFGLWGGAVLQLGTERHHREYLEATARGEIMGCFAMTETGHGSNVQAMGKTAVFDAETDEFVIDTPDVASARSTSATPECMPGWVPCSPSSRWPVRTTGCTRSPSRSATRRDGCSPESASRTAGSRSG